MPREPTTIRLNQSERDVIQAAARKRGEGWTTYMRNKALDAAARDLERDVPALRRRQDREPDRD